MYSHGTSKDILRENKDIKYNNITKQYKND